MSRRGTRHLPYPVAADPVAARAAHRRLVVAMVVVCCVLAVAIFVPGIALAASPVPTPEAGGDTRSAGEGPGLVGAPLLAIGLVLAIGIVAAGSTLLYVRATGGARLAEPATGPSRVGSGPGSEAREDDSFPG